jgi:alpha-amylase/alpha-mannosidase (GH57 family)
MVNFGIVIHNHQPVGNFDFVVRDASQKAYIPFLKTLKKFPKVRIGLHFSGVLLDMLAEYTPEVIDLVGELVSLGQVEIVGGAYGEPILPSCSVESIIEHILMQSNQIQKYFDTEPRGIWTPERVWEEWLPLPLASAGIEYTFLDDFHFLSAGLGRDDLNCRWITEHSGSKIHLFPISKTLRYLIPFSSPKDSIDFLESLPESSLAIFGDDGEKFGIWPHTYHSCYEEGWLENFFKLLTANNTINIMLPSESYENLKAKGPVYIPSCSYPEMMEWSLPPPMQNELKRLRPKTGLESTPEEAYMRGASWKNFLHRYPESNNMHKRVKLTELAMRKQEISLGKHFLSSQCNCGYWHGVFGGIYLPHLRRAVYRELIQSELDNNVRFEPWDVIDFNMDGHKEIILNDGNFKAVITHSHGAFVTELDSYKIKYNICDVLMRHEEAYSQEIANLGNGSAPGSIHDGIWLKEGQTVKNLVFDTERRGLFIDHFLENPPTWEDARNNNIHEISDLSTEAFEIDCIESGFVLLKNTGILNSTKLEISKSFSLSDGFLNVNYMIKNNSTKSTSFHFCPQFDIASEAGYGEYAKISWDGKDYGLNNDISDRVSNFELKMPNSAITLQISPPTNALQYIVETCSNSEGGIESIQQGLCVMPIYKINLLQGESYSISFKLGCNA